MLTVDLTENTYNAQVLTSVVQNHKQKYRWCIVFPKDGSMSEQEIDNTIEELEFNFGQKSLQMSVDTNVYPVYISSERCWLAFFKSVSEINLDENEELA